jgi:hypothetical protein
VRHHLTSCQCIISTLTMHCVAGWRTSGEQHTTSQLHHYLPQARVAMHSTPCQLIATCNPCHCACHTCLSCVSILPVLMYASGHWAHA